MNKQVDGRTLGATEVFLLALILTQESSVRESFIIVTLMKK